MSEQSTQEKRKPISKLNWMDISTIQHFTTETGKILPRRITGLSAKDQRNYMRQVKRARNMLMAL
ncbi:MAG: 30S ribosomal protein S18 [Verrucomicrobia bacterium GWC2_42_7]|nr:MAG: 30S ribosomal protein S18 [Verrucomicrobia bacterium GWC2_42_7]